MDNSRQWSPLTNERTRYFTVLVSALGLVALAFVFSNPDKGRLFWVNIVFILCSFALTYLFVYVVGQPKYGWKYENKDSKRPGRFFLAWVIFSPYLFYVIGKEYVAMHALSLFFFQLLLFPKYRS